MALPEIRNGDRPRGRDGAVRDDGSRAAGASDGERDVLHIRQPAMARGASLKDLFRLDRVHEMYVNSM